MGRLQRHYLENASPPKMKATRIDLQGMSRRMGADIAQQCFTEIQPKIFDEKEIGALNEKIADLWPALREELKAFVIPVEEMTRLLKAAGGPTTAQELGVPVDFYREAVVHCREMRNRYSFLDIAADEGILEDFSRGEV
jgi:glycerol-1-phosphate dehydrogenase [NAD(P)+]